MTYAPEAERLDPCPVAAWLIDNPGFGWVEHLRPLPCDGADHAGVCEPGHGCCASRRRRAVGPRMLGRLDTT